LLIDFPLRTKETAFGILSDPKVPVDVRTNHGMRRYRFLIDTGADFALAPRSLADEVGLDWDTLPRGSVRGIEQAGVPARFGRLPIRLGGEPLDVRCFFIDSPTAVLILGRADFLDRFVLTIDQPQRRITLQVAGA
jgi:hypothetical protein